LEINFYIRPFSKDQKVKLTKAELNALERPILMFIAFNGTREPINTKIKACSNIWDTDKQRANLKEGKAIASKINLDLTEWEEKAIHFKDTYHPANPKLLVRLLKGVEIKPAVDEKEFFIFFKNYMNTSIPAGSKHNYNKCLVHLESFSNHKYKVTWETLTAKFYQDYMRFLSEEYVNFRTGKKGILNSTITKDIWTLKDVCWYARKNGIQVPADVEDFAKPSNSKTKRIKITEERLQDLINFDFTDWTLISGQKRIKKHVEGKIIPNILKVRDIYVFSFYTGLAHKEIMKIQPDQVKAEKIGDRDILVIDFARSKTRKLNQVHLNKICLQIIEKYKGGKTLLPYFVNSQFNRICKSMFKLAKFNQKITLTRWSGDREITQTFEEWQLLTSHTGRHSAATNILKKTGDLTIVRDLLGHSSVKTTEIYTENDRESFNSKILNVIDAEPIKKD
jgi:site-specific recombinase XerD